MPYITYVKKPREKQITIWDVINGTTDANLMPDRDTKDTVTFWSDDVPIKILQKLKLSEIIHELKTFNYDTSELFEADRHSLYRSFKIPKKSGGFRQIDAPNEELNDALHRLKSIFEHTIGAPYHTCAFAYIPGRNTYQCVQRHQDNKSRWFAKFDFSKFFPSTTLEYVMKMFAEIYPYNEIISHPIGKVELEKALSLCFLDGHLPQGTPMSPMITNIMMIPMDLEIARFCREHKPHLVYTRYADDIQISSEYTFKWTEVQAKIVEIISKFNAPFVLNKEKTRYGSSAGRNWNLGLMLNKDNQITVGYKRKKILKATIFSFMMSDAKGERWELGEVQELLGNINYCRQIEKETIDGILKNLSEKFNKDVIETVKAQLKP